MESSEVYRLSQSGLLSYLARHHGKWPAVIALSIIAGLGLTAWIFADLRFLILALMVLFIVVPMIMAFLYFSYALDADVSFNVLPHSIGIDNSGIYVKIMPRRDKKNSTDDDYDDEEEIAEPVVKFYSFSRFGRYEVGYNCLYLQIKQADEKAESGNSGFLYLPIDIFQDVSSPEAFLTCIKEHRLEKNLTFFKDRKSGAAK